MSYVGALKSWIYAAVFQIWIPTAISVRLPMILISAISIWCFYRLLVRIGGHRAAVCGVLLLATDATYLLTSCYDWGPVAIQHLCLIAGMLGIIRFYGIISQKKIIFHAELSLAAGFLFFGLGLWDKALFIWLLGGMGIAALAIFPKQLWSALTPRRIMIAAAAFLIGALPVVIYNIRQPLQTFRGNAKITTEDWGGKLLQVRLNLEGRGLFGYIVNEDSAENPREPETRMERASIWLSRVAGERRVGFLGYALFAALIFAPFWWRSRVRPAIFFSLITLLIAWLQMALTKDAGGAAHHVVLLWPFPHLIVAVAFAEASRRIPRLGTVVLAVVLVVVCGQNLLVLNQYLSQLIRNGAAGNWTDALYPLADAAKNLKASDIYIIDWGILNTVGLLDRGQLPLRVANDPFMSDTPTAVDKQTASAWVANSSGVFVGHVEGKEEFAGVGARLKTMAEAAGYRKVIIALVNDRNGRPTFEIFRFAQAASTFQ